MEEAEEEIEKKKFEAYKNERWPKILLQIIFPFLIAGFGKLS